MSDTSVKRRLLTKRRMILESIDPSQGLYGLDARHVDSEETSVFLPLDLVASLGHPAQITVTVEPGDRLND